MHGCNRFIWIYAGIFQALTHDDAYALDILEHILGQGKTSRLYRALKMEANLVYNDQTPVPMPWPTPASSPWMQPCIRKKLDLGPGHHCKRNFPRNPSHR